MNSINYRSAATPTIDISCARQEDHWVISVRDNGIGLEPEYADKIFGIFRRLHTRSERSGNGMGLAICKKIATRHGGRIWVESKLGEGATFRFTVRAISES
jgi:chemotaxis family two-component system sensor kinase Cph1